MLLADHKPVAHCNSPVETHRIKLESKLPVAISMHNMCGMSLAYFLFLAHIIIAHIIVYDCVLTSRILQEQRVLSKKTREKLLFKPCLL